MGVNCSQSVPVYVTQRCGSSWVVVDRCGIVVGRCGSLWDRCGSLWIVVGRCGSFRVLVTTGEDDVKQERIARVECTVIPRYSYCGTCLFRNILLNSCFESTRVKLKF